MPIEAANYLSDLNVSNPSGSDQVAELDNHIRLIKSVLKNTFPNLSGPVVSSQSGLNATVPIGGIIMWSGTLVSIPTGWVLCAGQMGLTRSDSGGTINAPDLRNRFVWGAGDSAQGYWAPLLTGGSGTHSHSGSVAATALAVEHLPAHSHGVSDPGHAHGVYDPGHQHSYQQGQQGPLATAGSAVASYGSNVTVPDSTSFTGIQIQGAGTGIAIQSTGSGWGHTHGLTLGVADHTPPFMALAFIMKI